MQVTVLLCRGVLKRKTKVFRNGSCAKRRRVAHMFNHGRWRLVAIGGWRLTTGSWWRLVVVGGGWWLVIGGWWRLTVVGVWRLAVGGGGWWLPQ